MKLIHLGGRQYQLYDLSTDPDEREDLASDPAKLQPMLDAFARQARHAPRDQRQGRLAGGAMRSTR